MQERQGEGRSLARARRRLTDQIATRKQRRNRLPLDRRRFLVAQVRQGGQQAGIQAQRRKPGERLC